MSRRFINELCTADHQLDAATLAHWLAIKAPENVLKMIANPNSFHVLTVGNARLQGVGAICRDGHVRMLYLLPGVQRRGVRKAIYFAKEQQARSWGLHKLTAESNTDAGVFYEHMGFRPTGDAMPFFGEAPSWPDEK